MSKKAGWMKGGIKLRIRAKLARTKTRLKRNFKGADDSIMISGHSRHPMTTEKETKNE